jgi:hypothetical protein
MKLNHVILAAGILVFGAGCGSSSNMSSGYSSTAVVVPATTQTEFQLRYPTATNIEWARYNDVAVPIDWDLTDWVVLDDNDYVVRYTMDNNNYYSWYDSDGNWIGSSYMLTDYTRLPAPVSSLISSQYGGYTISSVNHETWKDRMAYEVELKNATTKMKLLVDANGNILKQKTKSL